MAGGTRKNNQAGVKRTRPTTPASDEGSPSPQGKKQAVEGSHDILGRDSLTPLADEEDESTQPEVAQKTKAADGKGKKTAVEVPEQQPGHVFDEEYFGTARAEPYMIAVLKTLFKTRRAIAAVKSWEEGAKVLAGVPTVRLIDCFSAVSTTVKLARVALSEPVPTLQMPLFNIATLDPRRFTNKAGRYIGARIDNTPTVAYFFTVGVVMGSELLNGKSSRSVNLALFSHLMPRIQANIASVFGVSSVVFTTFKNGFTFQSQMTPAPKTDAGSKKYVPTVKTSPFTSPVKNSSAKQTNTGASGSSRKQVETELVTRRKANENIPIYDGLDKNVVDISGYRAFAAVDDELEAGSAAAVIFTLSAYAPTDNDKRSYTGIDDFDRVVSLNLIDVVSLHGNDNVVPEEPEDGETETGPAEEYGVRD